ncbi:AAA family ATPase [Nocardia yamanashiensis]|uniref:BTAD domain-containing putative transcriptional regulator n=1 Tax=Nocardia yamanashiensis TaxID=209247 RepID=UPI001E3E5B6B|nr:BTAD domain-containing putative transcriptional regulator [Nocardia yamanashiensis]UGT44498.1 AAA family ATPase [Nocardia yamanashiensis]
MVEINVLGAFGLTVAGTPADLGGTRQRAVLARLVAARGEMVPVDRLIDDLWADEPPPRALAGVQVFISHLRRAVEPGRAPRTPARVLVTAAPGYALRLPADAVDAWRFEDLLDRAARTTAPTDRTALLDTALSLWRGPAYAEFGELRWAATEAARLTELRLTAVERRAAARLETGTPTPIVAELEAHLAAHPLREESWRLLALALYRTGRQADALSALRRIRDLLAEELGVDPGPPLRALEADILAHAPHLDAPPAAGPPASGGPAPSFGDHDPVIGSGPQHRVSRTDTEPAVADGAPPVFPAAEAVRSEPAPVRGSGVKAISAGHGGGAESDSAGGEAVGDLARGGVGAVGDLAGGGAAPADDSAGGNSGAEGTSGRPVSGAAGTSGGRGNGSGGKPAGWGNSGGAGVRWPSPKFGDGEFFGRESEVAAVAGAIRRGGRVALIAGEPGMGKTALVERVAAELPEWVRVWGLTPETEAAPAGWAWVEILRQLDGRWPVADPLLRAMLAGEGGQAVGGDPASARFRTHRALAGYLAGAAAKGPLLLVLEDLHRADEETIALLKALPQRVPGVAMVGTYRPGELPEAFGVMLGELAALEPVRVELGGLPDTAVGELVRACCAGEVGESVVAAICERTGGNPFFVRETARLLAAAGPEAALQAVPSGVADVLRRRISRLPAVAQTVLKYAAVAGRDVDVDLVAAITGESEDTVLDALEAGVLTGLLVEDTDEIGQVWGVRFTHVLIRDTLYDSVSRLRRARIHGRVADVLGRRPASDPARLAQHCVASGEVERLTDVVEYSCRAAELAESRFAHRTAAGLWEQALAAFDKSETGVAERRADQARQRIELEIAHIRSRALSGDIIKARVLRDRALSAALRIGDPILSARVITGFDVPTLWVNRMYGTRESAVIDAAEAALPAVTDPELRVRLLTSLAMQLDSEPGPRGRETAAEAVALARTLGRPELLVHALNGQYLNLYHSADLLPAQQRVANEILALATVHGLGLYQVLGHLLLQQITSAQLDLPAAADHWSTGTRLALEMDLPLLGKIGDWGECMRHTLSGRFEAAEAKYLDTAAKIRKGSSFGGEVATAWVGLYTIRYAQGRLGEMVDDTLRLHETLGRLSGTADMYALALLEAGRPADAAAAMREVTGPDGPGRVRADFHRDLHLSLRGLVAAGLADPVLASPVYDELLPYADRFAGTMTAALALCPVSLVLGDLAALLRRDDPAAHYRHAATVARRAGAPHWETTARRRIRQLPAHADAPHR